MRGFSRDPSAHESFLGLLLRASPVGEGGPGAHACRGLRPAKEGSLVGRLPGVHPHGLELGVHEVWFYIRNRAGNPFPSFTGVRL
jgi:hypothetical protein